MPLAQRARAVPVAGQPIVCGERADTTNGQEEARGRRPKAVIEVILTYASNLASQVSPSKFCYPGTRRAPSLLPDRFQRAE